jgi:hypothetical protein
MFLAVDLESERDIDSLVADQAVDADLYPSGGGHGLLRFRLLPR